MNAKPRIVQSLSAAIVGLVLLSGCAALGLGDSQPPEPTVIESIPTPTRIVEPIVDSGVIEHATGDGEHLPDGTVRYVVQEDDITGVICDRFGLNGNQLVFEDGSLGKNCYSMIYPGDVVILSSALLAVPE
jgi:hypothetical protein